MEQTISLQKEAIEITPSGNRSWEPLRFRSRHAIALLGYLAVERRPISRAYLARLLWPDYSQSNGRTSLRRELYSLTQLLPDCWQLDRQSVSFVPSKDIDLDIYILLEMESQEYWIQAVDLIGGEFLEGLYLDNNLEFENWLTGERNHWQWREERILTYLIEAQILRGHYRDGLEYCQRLLKLAPWKEDAYKQAMRLLTWTGQRGAALHQFETCKQTLKIELDVEPSGDTIAVYQQILAGELDLPPQRPTFFEEEAARHEVTLQPFVAREREMQQLHNALDKTLAGQGRVIFVIGDAGRGKTVLMEAFAREAMETHANLLVASGSCNAFSGIGDPYLPFRDIMAMLTGDVENKWDTGDISRDHAIRLWEAFPIVANALLEYAPNLLDVFIQGMALLERVTFFELTSCAPWILKLKKFIKHHQTSMEDFELNHLFQQITNMLQAIARKKPLLLILDDMQWVDDASISLLFHLGRRFSGTNSKILILCALRPEEVFSGRGGERHPLVKLLNEFKRVFNDEWVNLDQTGVQEARRFIDAILDIEPNRLGESFRSAMLQRTNAHPLFAVELLNAMREGSDLFKDENGYWIEAANLDWNLLPTKVEAVIKERIERLDPKLQEILTIASVEGEVFTAEIVAEVQGEEERSILRYLSIGLEQQHRLVREQEGIEIRGRFFSRFKFSHILFQNYIYEHLCEGERRLHHASIANAIEKLYVNQLDSMAVQLAHHLHQAGDFSRAFQYYIQAAKRAASIYANNEAISHYSKAVGLINKVFPENYAKANLYRERGSVYERLGEFNHALYDYETALDCSDKINDQWLKWRILIDLGKLWASRDYNLNKEYFESALNLAQSLDQPELLAESLNWIGNWYTNADKPQTAFRYHQDALSIVNQINSPQVLANTLDLLGISNLMGGNLKDCKQYYDEAISIFRDLDNRSRLVSCLTGRAASYSMLVLMTSISATSPSKAFSDVNEAIRIAGEISSSLDQPWAFWALGLLYTVHGQYGEALNALQCGLHIATQIGHNEFELGLLFGLGLLFNELFDSDQALEHLKKSVAMAKDLDSRIHIHISYGLLAGAYLTQRNIALAQKCLDEVISKQTPMDTVGKRHCWLRRAEIALAQEKPELAMNIIDRLISSAPGIETGDVITYLWMLKGETFRRLGLFDKAFSFLQIAVTNAQKMEETFLLWRVHASLGQLYYAMNHPGAVEKEILTSRSIVNNIAATILDPVIKDKYIKGAYNILSYN